MHDAFDKSSSKLTVPSFGSKKCFQVLCTLNTRIDSSSMFEGLDFEADVEHRCNSS